jgi:hypothetical protein
MSKHEVQEAAAALLEMMRIPTSSRFQEPISAIVDQATSKWLGFIRVDLLNPLTDGLALLRGDWVFTLQLKQEFVIGKVEKGFEFQSITINKKLWIQSASFTKYNSRQLLSDLICLGYILGQQIEFAGISKRLPEQDFAKVTLITEETKPQLLQRSVSLVGERVIVSIPSCEPRPNLSPDALTTTLLMKGIPLDKSQIQVTAAIHRLMEVKNVLMVTYNRAENDELGRYDGLATIRCLNSMVHTHWVNRSDVHFLGKIVEFAPHKRSLAGSTPNSASRVKLSPKPSHCYRTIPTQYPPYTTWKE